ncbi:MAG: hypothetical protein WBD99_04620 [Thermodesulfobacteriota bacterium]
MSNYQRTCAEPFDFTQDRLSRSIASLYQDKEVKSDKYPVAPIM